MTFSYLKNEFSYRSNDSSSYLYRAKEYKYLFILLNKAVLNTKTINSPLASKFIDKKLSLLTIELNYYILNLITSFRRKRKSYAINEYKTREFVSMVRKKNS